MWIASTPKSVRVCNANANATLAAARFKAEHDKQVAIDNARATAQPQAIEVRADRNARWLTATLAAGVNQRLIEFV